MKIEYLLPLIGVFIGWLLSELSQLFKERRENKRIAKRTIFFLIEIKLYLSFLNPILKNIIQATSLQKDFNDILKEIFENKEYTADYFEKLTSDSISNLSSLNPYLALSFKQLMANSKMILSKNFISQHLNPLNKNGIQLINDGINLTLTDIDDLIKILSFRYNRFYWFREKLKTFKRKNKIDHWQNLFAKFNK
ncbi:MAG: hypothetical protein MUP85_22435 [Candidatus Lokiarchaeota archaeon]|nr:hypothetical protein [Candidatus Lokiarchaeota archaeon]